MKPETLICTICCREKRRDDGLLPAIERYRSRRIQNVFRLAEKAGRRFAILSGKFGLIEAEKPIPYYDQLLREEDIPFISRQIIYFLKKYPVRKILFFSPDPEKDPLVSPYIRSLRAAARAVNIPLKIQFVPPYPTIIK